MISPKFNARDNENLYEAAGVITGVFWSVVIVLSAVCVVLGVSGFFGF